MKNFLLIPLLCAVITSTGQTNLDSLWGIWNDQTLPDTVRLHAFFDLTIDGFLYEAPDSAYNLAQVQYDFSKQIGSSKFMAKSLHLQGISLRFQGDNSGALQHYRRAVDHSTEAGDLQRSAKLRNSMGIVYEERGSYDLAIEQYMKSLAISESIKDSLGIANCINNIGIIYDEQEDYDKAISYYTRCAKIYEQLGDVDGTFIALTNIGNIKNAQGMHDEAIHLFNRCRSIADSIGDQGGIATCENNLGSVYGKIKVPEQALEHYMNALRHYEALGEKSGIALALTNIGTTYKDMAEYQLSIEFGERALSIAKAIGSASATRLVSGQLYQSYKALNEDEKALQMFELHIQMRDSILSEENQREVLRQEYKYEYEKEALTDSLEFAKKEAVKNLEIEKQQVSISRQRVGLASAGIGLLLILALAITIRRGKQKSDALLLNILPEETAKELKAKGSTEAKLIENVTVLFTDFKGFTAMSEQLSPKELVSDLNICFSEFDKIMEKYGIEKIKTIGDAYMAACGLPSPNSDHAQKVVLAAFEMRDFVEAGKARKIAANLPYFEIRIGVHTGPVVAGIVGIKKFQYDIWGDTVNTASRMESSGEVGNVNISEATYQLLKDDSRFTFESRGKVAAKGKGQLEMYFARLA